MEWSNGLILEFLDLYEKEPVLWNPSHPMHSNRSEVYEGWKRIQGQLGVDCSTVDLKRKKDSLMACYRTCTKKVKDCKRSGSGNIFKPNWFAYEKMANFLRRRVQPMDAEDAARLQRDKRSNDDSVGDESVVTANPLRRMDTERRVCELNSYTPTPPIPKKSKIHSPYSIKLHARMEEEEEEEVVVVKKEDQYSTAAGTRSVPRNDRQKDDCDLYGELIARKLRKMDERTRDVAMNTIDNLLFQMKMEPYKHRHKQHRNYHRQNVLASVCDYAALYPGDAGSDSRSPQTPSSP